MKKLIILFIAVIIISGCSANQHAELLRDLKAIDFNQASENLDEALSDFYEIVSPKGIAISVIFPNGQIWSSAAGISGIDESLDDGMVIEIGSVTKTFTAVVIMQLIEEKKLSLDDTVDELLPWLWEKLIREEDRDKKINVSELLKHTGGLYPVNLLANISFTPYAFSKNFDMYRLIHGKADAIADKYGQLGVNADIHWEYSNDGYILLGFIIEELTGKKLSDVYEERIFDRINLDNTFLNGPDVNWDNIRFAHPWTDLDRYKDDLTDFAQEAGIQKEVDEVFTNTDKWIRGLDDASSVVYNKLYPQAYSAGGIFSTVTELNLFMRSLFDYELVSKKSLNEMMETMYGGYYMYGYGLMCSFLKANGAPLSLFNNDPKGTGAIQFYGHGGAIPGYRTWVMYSPDIELGIAAVINEDDHVPETYIHLFFKAIINIL